ncbi:Protein of unknown function [Gryllus bimaculatus]|nr:Protein of unknown function [Gryllus bimaculatus]
MHGWTAGKVRRWLRRSQEVVTSLVRWFLWWSVPLASAGTPLYVPHILAPPVTGSGGGGQRRGEKRGRRAEELDTRCRCHAIKHLTKPSHVATDRALKVTPFHVDPCTLISSRPTRLCNEYTDENLHPFRDNKRPVASLRSLLQ